MDELDAVVDDVLDEQIDDQVDDAAPVDDVPADDTQPDQQDTDDPYTTRFSREMRAALKAWGQSNPEAAKFAKQASANHARLFALQQLEPTGIDGVREKYALLDSIMDGDLKGLDAVQALQDRAQQYEQTDQLLASGDPKVLDAFGEEFNGGLAKLAPAILDRVAKSDPQAYEAAILPHAVGILSQSPMVQEYNRAVDQLTWALGDRKITQLSEPELRQFAQAALNAIAGVGNNLNALGQKAGEVKTAPQGQPQANTQQEQFERQQQQFHWDSKIKPLAVQHENAKFEELFKPYNLRLKLDDPSKQALLRDFKQALGNAAKSDQQYMSQMKRYQGQKNPDAQTVANFVKNGINKHAQNVIKALVDERYGRFLAAKPKTQTVTAKTGTTAPKEANVEIRSVKPAAHEIDHRNTPTEWMAASYPGGKKYRLYSGKVVQVRPQA